jgi:hypothetical protein
MEPINFVNGCLLTRVVGYAGWTVIASFFSGEFFLHALWAIVIALLLSFSLLTAIIRVSLNFKRIAGRAPDRLKPALLPMLRVHLQTVLRMTAVLPD